MAEAEPFFFSAAFLRISPVLGCSLADSVDEWWLFGWLCSTCYCVSLTMTLWLWRADFNWAILLSTTYLNFSLSCARRSTKMGIFNNSFESLVGLLIASRFSMAARMGIFFSARFSPPFVACVDISLESFVRIFIFYPKSRELFEFLAFF